MNRKKIALGIGIVLVILAAFTAPAAADAEVWFSNPDDPNGPGEPLNVTAAVGENVTIQIMWYTDANESGARSFQVGVDYDRSVVNMTGLNPWFIKPYMHYWDNFHSRYYDDETAPLGAYLWIIGTHPACWQPTPITVPIANLTVECVSGGTSSLNFTHEIRHEPTVGWSLLTNCTDELLSITWYNNVIECVGPPETFSKHLSAGWNLISLPLIPSNNSTSAVLGNDTIEYDAVYRYNATSKQFEDVTTGTMDPGTGYFVNVTTAGTWSYEGTPYTSLNIDLKKGLNMVGWLNCTKQISGNLTSIAGEYNYIARWNAGYEVYEPHAPEVFNDFFDMERGNGYWIAAKEDCKLEESCSG